MAHRENLFSISLGRSLSPHHFLKNKEKKLKKKSVKKKKTNKAAL